MSKAFDCVIHKTLLIQLEHTGIRGNSLKLMESYLTNRTQAVVLDTYNKDSRTIERILSEFKPISLGVPQGSVLGPLLFLVYDNELQLLFNYLCVMFADDAAIFVPNHGHNISEFNAVVNSTLGLAVDWLSSLNLKVNLSKTKILQFRNYKREAIRLNIINKDENIEEVDYINFLGVTIDTNLNWKLHIENNNRKICSYCYALSILRNVTSEDVARSAYFGYVYPLLSYGIIFWGCSVESQSSFVLQKKCV
jgi:hypothetical protein